MRHRSPNLLLVLVCLAILAHKAAAFNYVETLGSANGQIHAETPHEVFPLFDFPILGPMGLKTSASTPQKEKEWRELKAKILTDFSGRMSADFKVPEGLRERTSFWFDIYARYGEAHHIIHHVRYPWIIFKVVDTTELLANGKGPLWLRRDRGSKLAQREANEVRRTLQLLGKRKSFANLSGREKELYDQLAELPGPRATVFKQAAQSVRSQLGQKDFFERGLVKSSRYLPLMEVEFQKLGLPIELTRMPFVESSFNEDARSKVGASGIWQIMPLTGKSYMIVNDHIDERNSPLKATIAAGRLLRSYYRAMSSWPLTITSYNHGIGNIQKAIRKSGSHDLATIIARYHQGDFRFASSNFFTCFLAALYAEKYHELIFKNVPREPLQETEIFRLAGSTRASYLEKMTGLDRETLLKYNLDLRRALKLNISLPRGYNLHVPPGYKQRLNQLIGVQEKTSRPKS